MTNDSSTSGVPSNEMGTLQVSTSALSSRALMNMRLPMVVEILSDPEFEADHGTSRDTQCSKLFTLPFVDELPSMLLEGVLLDPDSTGLQKRHAAVALDSLALEFLARFSLKPTTASCDGGDLVSDRAVAKELATVELALNEVLRPATLFFRMNAPSDPSLIKYMARAAFILAFSNYPSSLRSGNKILDWYERLILAQMHALLATKKKREAASSSEFGIVELQFLLLLPPVYERLKRYIMLGAIAYLQDSVQGAQNLR